MTFTSDSGVEVQNLFFHDEGFIMNIGNPGATTNDKFRQTAKRIFQKTEFKKSFLFRYYLRAKLA